MDRRTGCIIAATTDLSSPLLRTGRVFDRDWQGDGMHVTSDEIAAGSLVVAALAVIASVVTSRAANINQRKLAEEQYLREQRTKAYLDLLAVSCGKREGSIDAALTNIEGELEARLMAYASPDVYTTWTKYIVFTARYERMLVGQPSDESASDYFSTWEAAKDQLVRQIRSELGTPGSFNLSQVSKLQS
jgi:hypothetical protein